MAESVKVLLGTKIPCFEITDRFGVTYLDPISDYTPEKALESLLHLAEKPWITKEHLAQVMQLALVYQRGGVKALKQRSGQGHRGLFS